MNKVVPFLWFACQIEEALAYYQAVFPGFKVRFVEYGPFGPEHNKRVRQAHVSLGDQDIYCADLQKNEAFNVPAGAICVECSSENELKRLKLALAEDSDKIFDLGRPNGQEWAVRDKFGVTWLLRYGSLANAQCEVEGNVCMANSPEVRPEYRE